MESRLLVLGEGVRVRAVLEQKFDNFRFGLVLGREVQDCFRGRVVTNGVHVRAVL